MHGNGRRSVVSKVYELKQDPGDQNPDWHKLNKLAGYNLPRHAVSYFDDEEYVSQRYEIIYGKKEITHRIISTNTTDPTPELHEALLKEGFYETSK